MACWLPMESAADSREKQRGRRGVGNWGIHTSLQQLHAPNFINDLGYSGLWKSANCICISRFCICILYKHFLWNENKIFLCTFVILPLLCILFKLSDYRIAQLHALQHIFKHYRVFLYSIQLPYIRDSIKGGVTQKGTKYFSYVSLPRLSKSQNPLLDFLITNRYLQRIYSNYIVIFLSYWSCLYIYNIIFLLGTK